MPIFVDSHCHLDFNEFDTDRTDVILRAGALGLSKIMVPGVSVSQWQQIQQLSAQHANIYWAAGLHPWWLAKALPVNNTIFEAQLAQALHQPKCLAVGECGLDEAIDIPMAEQERCLLMQLQLAKAINKPVILHCYKAHNLLLTCLRKVGGLSGILHGFSGSAELALEYWRMNIALGIGGTITYTRANKTRLAVAALPKEALVLETDAPSMPISGRQGQRNSPEHIPQIAACLAQLRCEPLDEVAAYTTANAERIFRWSIENNLADNVQPLLRL